MKRRGLLAALAACLVTPMAMSIPAPRRIPAPPSAPRMHSRYAYFSEANGHRYQVPGDYPGAVGTMLFWTDRIMKYESRTIVAYYMDCVAKAEARVGNEVRFRITNTQIGKPVPQDWLSHPRYER